MNLKARVLLCYTSSTRVQAGLMRLFFFIRSDDNKLLGIGLCRQTLFQPVLTCDVC